MTEENLRRFIAHVKVDKALEGEQSKSMADDEVAVIAKSAGFDVSVDEPHVRSQHVTDEELGQAAAGRGSLWHYFSEWFGLNK